MKRFISVFTVFLALVLLAAAPCYAADTKQTITTGVFEKRAMTAAGDIIKGANSEIDASNKNNAYVKVRYTASTSKRVKVKIECTVNGKAVAYSYDLNSKGNWETFPLQSGNGKYTIKVMENIEGTRYSVKQTAAVDVTYSNPNAPYLIPMQLVNYSDTSKVVEKAAELTKGKTDDLAKVEACYKFIVETIKYDYDKANGIKNGTITSYVPDVDIIIDSKKGICFDYSSVLAAMLRSQGIPTKLDMGYVPIGKGQNAYHAWNEVYITGQGWVKVNTQIYFDGKDWSRMDATFSAAGAGDFIGNGSNYAKDKEY